MVRPAIEESSLKSQLMVSAFLSLSIRHIFLVLLALVSFDVFSQNVKTDWIASVILSDAKPLDPERFAAALRKKLTVQERFTGIEPGKGIVVLRVAGGTAMISLIDRPVPKGELQEVCRAAWYWRDACNTIKDHKAHFLVVLMATDLDKLGSAVLQTKIISAMLEESNAVATYWGDSLQSRETFLKASAGVSRENIPATLWISYRLSKESTGNFSLSTQGLKDFKLMEIETKNAPMPGVDLLGLILNTTQYLIKKGPVIKDGDTIGDSAQQKIRVRHAESYWNAGEKVYRVEFSG